MSPNPNSDPAEAVFLHKHGKSTRIQTRQYSHQCQPCDAAAQVLFMFGNVIKTLFAKMMSSHYYKASQFEKLQDALKKVR